MNEIIEKSIKDFLTPKMLFISAIPVIIALVLVVGLITVGGISILNMTEQLYVEQNSDTIFSMIFSFAILKLITVSLFYIFGIFIAQSIGIFIALFIIGFLTPSITQEINRRHYNVTYDKKAGFWLVSKKMLIVFLKFIPLFLISLPFVFIPFIGFLPISLAFFYLYYKLMIIDVGSNALSLSEFLEFYKNSNKAELIAICAIFYLLCLVPFVALFCQVLFIIILTHMIFSKYHISN